MTTLSVRLANSLAEGVRHLALVGLLEDALNDSSASS
jgi:hypothetical protein